MKALIYQQSSGKSHIHVLMWLCILSFGFFSVCEETEHLYVYNAYGAAVSEVELDVLTGEVQILRVDILYDCGQRYNENGSTCF